MLGHRIIHLNLKNNKNLYINRCIARCGNQKEFIPDINRLFIKLKLDSPDNYYLFADDLNAKHTNWKNSK